MMNEIKTNGASGNGFVSITKMVKKNTGGRSISDSVNKVYLSKYENKADKREVLSVYVGKNVAEKVRFMPGDYIEVLFNPATKEILLRRTNDRAIGYTIGWSGGKRGSSNILKLQMSYPPELKSIINITDVTELENVHESQAGIIGRVPGGVK